MIKGQHELHWKLQRKNEYVTCMMLPSKISITIETNFSNCQYLTFSIKFIFLQLESAYKNAYNVSLATILFTNDKNKNTRNVSISCYHGNCQRFYQNAAYLKDFISILKREIFIVYTHFR